MYLLAGLMPGQKEQIYYEVCVLDMGISRFRA